MVLGRPVSDKLAEIVTQAWQRAGHISVASEHLHCPSGGLATISCFVFSLENCLDGDWPLFPPIPPRGLVDELLKAGSVHVAFLGVFLSLGGIMMFTTKAFVWFRV